MAGMRITACRRLTAAAALVAAGTMVGCTQPTPATTTTTTAPAGSLALGCYNGVGSAPDLKVDDHLYSLTGVRTGSLMGTTNGTCGPATGQDMVLVKDTTVAGEVAGGTCASLLGTGGAVTPANVAYPTISSAWWICL